MVASKELTYKIIIEECPEGGFYAECPAFSGCHVEGDTFEETLSEMKAAIQNYIDDFHKSGEPIPEDSYAIASVKVSV